MERTRRANPFPSVALAAVLLLHVVVGCEKTNKGLALPGLQRPVEVLTDDLGVPHIYAENDHDVFYVQGYVHARDRFFQMDSNRRAAYGTLAELTGSFTDLTGDAGARLMGFRLAAQRSFDLLEPVELADGQAYADGVNAWLASNPLPPEYAELEVTAVPPWTVLDTLTMAKALAGSIGIALYEIDVTSAFENHVEALGESAGTALFYQDRRRFAQFLPHATVPDALGASSFAAGSPRERPARTRGGPQAKRGPHLATVDPSLFGRVARDPAVMRGSNVWGVAASKSATGRPLVANDGHNPLTAPARDYEIHLVVRKDPALGPMNVSGFSSPGLPAVGGGQNPYIVWGATAQYPDVSDVFRDRLVRGDPGCPARLCIDSAGALHPVEERAENYRLNLVGDGVPDNSLDLTSAVARIAPQSVNVLSVPFRSYGPVLDVEDRSVLSGGAATETPVLTLQYTGFHGTREAKWLFAIQRAKNVFEFVEATRFVTTPLGANNHVVADVAGNLAYVGSSEIPLRADLEAGTVAGTPPWLIRDGSGPANWIPDPSHSQGQVLPFRVLPRDEMPHVVNPPAGYVVNCNEDPFGFGLDNDLLNQFRPSNPQAIHYTGDPGTTGLRNSRVTELLREKLDAGEKLTIEDIERIQGDTHATDAALTVPFLLAAFENAQRAGAPPELAAFANDGELAEAVVRLTDWDFSMPTGIPEGYDASDVDGERNPTVSPEEAANSVAGTLFVVWRWRLVENQFFGPLAAFGLRGSSIFAWKGLYYLLSQQPFTGVGASGIDFFPAPAGLDAADRRDVALLRALRETLDKLASPAYETAFAGSKSQSDFRWGRLHRLVLAHRLAGDHSIPPAGGFADLAPELPGLAREGGFDTVNQGAHSDGDSPAAMLFSAGAVGRSVSSPVRPSRTGAGMLGFRSLSGGSSGDPASPLYASQLGKWLTVDYHAVPMTVQAVVRHPHTTERFVPAKLALAGQGGPDASE